MKQEIIRDVIFNHYINDISFPRSCGSISMILTLIFQDSSLKNKYDISYVRGHFRNDFEEEDCECEVSFYDSYNRFSDLEKFDCMNCTCEYMVGHSWIELKNKNTNEITIVDFTNIQFDENIRDYEQEIIDSNGLFEMDEIFEYLKERSVFIVDKDHEYFSRYIASKEVLSGSDILNTTKDMIKENIDTDVTIILDRIGYKISI